MASKGSRGCSRKRRSTTPTVNEASPSPPAPSSAPPPRPLQAAVAPHPWPPQGGAAPHPWPPQVVAAHPRPPQGTVPPTFGAGIDGGQSSSANPWGGYLNMLQQPHFPPLRPFGEIFHFVGVGNSMNPPSPAPTPPGRVTIDIDVDDGVDARGAKKRFLVYDEEVKLASAWLNTSKDPIHGNDKKSNSFWGQITEKFNKDTQPDHIRDSNQLKCHWKRLSTIINEFNGYWASVCKLNKSGYSDDQLMDEAQKMFTKKHGKPFAHVHWWRILKNEPKWCTHAAQSDR